jgi:predicted restriction endonuclease
MEYWGGRCAVTGLDVGELLRASHIKPWARCESDAERLDVYNGLLLAPHLDALFDRGLITFSDEGNLTCSSQLSEHQWGLVGVGNVERCVRSLTDEHRKYLRWHRSEVFRDDC